MHKKFITKGLVLGKQGLGEANIAVMLLCEELGLVRAAARSARHERSKLRYGLEVLTEGRYSLVRGKQEWRLVGVEEVSRACIGRAVPHRTRAGQIGRLLLRLMPGEEGNRALYVSVVEGLRALARVESEEDATATECVLVLRILSHLGYLPQLPEIAPFVESDFFTQDLALQAKHSRAFLIKLINDSLSASGL